VDEAALGEKAQPCRPRGIIAENTKLFNEVKKYFLHWFLQLLQASLYAVK